MFDDDEVVYDYSSLAEFTNEIFGHEEFDLDDDSDDALWDGVNWDIPEFDCD